jgi:hypothetical protein
MSTQPDSGSSQPVARQQPEFVAVATQGVPAAFLLTGYGRGEREYQSSTRPKRSDRIAENRLEAVDDILRDLARLRQPVDAASPLRARAPRSL